MNTTVKSWVLGVYLLIAVVISGGVYYYKVYYMKVSPTDCIQKYDPIAILPEAKELVVKSCTILSGSAKNIIELDVDRKLAVCILRDPMKLAAKDLKDLLAYIEPCYTEK